jgi:hypothetical protein
VSDVVLMSSDKRGIMVECHQINGAFCVCRRSKGTSVNGGYTDIMIVINWGFLTVITTVVNQVSKWT